jgi:hypothetical protein
MQQVFKVKKPTAEDGCGCINPGKRSSRRKEALFEFSATRKQEMEPPYVGCYDEHNPLRDFREQRVLALPIARAYFPSGHQSNPNRLFLVLRPISSGSLRD